MNMWKKKHKKEKVIIVTLKSTRKKCVRKKKTEHTHTEKEKKEKNEDFTFIRVIRANFFIFSLLFMSSKEK